MKHNYLLTVIVPTRNRQKYALKCIEYILSLKLNIQLIVCDNSDNRSLEENVKAFETDPCFKYVYISQRIACVDNYETAASLAEGEYFCAIGDDDTILPNIINVTLWMKKNNIDAVKSSVFLNYWWPQKDSNFLDRRKNGCVWCDKLAANTRSINTFDGVIKLLQNGGQDYLALDLIRSYHGIVKTSRLIEAKEKSGRFYGGCSPDIYSSVSLSLLPNIKCYEIGIPFTLPGVCSQSTSSDSEKGKHAGDLETAPQFVGMVKPYDWDEIIPKYYTVQTIWAETAITAVKNMGYEWMLSKYFNREKLIEEMIKKNPAHKEKIERIVLADGMHISFNKETPKKNNKKKVFNRIRRLLNIIINRVLFRLNCPSIENGASLVNSFLNNYRNRKIVRKVFDDK